MNLLKKAEWYEKLAMELVSKTQKEVEALPENPRAEAIRIRMAKLIALTKD